MVPFSALPPSPKKSPPPLWSYTLIDSSFDRSHIPWSVPSRVSNQYCSQLRASKIHLSWKPYFHPLICALDRFHPLFCISYLLWFWEVYIRDWFVQLVRWVGLGNKTVFDCDIQVVALRSILQYKFIIMVNCFMLVLTFVLNWKTVELWIYWDQCLISSLY